MHDEAFSIISYQKGLLNLQIPILLTQYTLIWYLSDMSFDKSVKVLEKWSVNYPIIGETRCHRAVRHKQMISAISN